MELKIDFEVIRICEISGVCSLIMDGLVFDLKIPLKNLKIGKFKNQKIGKKLKCWKIGKKNLKLGKSENWKEKFKVWKLKN